MTKVSNYVADFIAGLGIRHVFVVQGGAVAHLIDSVGSHPELTYIASAHEQAAAIAVDGYVRVTRGMGCAMATTGPGIMNLLTGIACLYYDSLPGLFIGGQVSTFRLRRRAPGVRQLGFQEGPHVELVQHVTKYCVLVDDPKRIRYELEKAVHIANSGRPGPVFLDICDDVQRAEIDPQQLEGYVPEGKPLAPPGLDSQVDQILDALARAKRPLIVLGAAIRITKREEQALSIVRRCGVPVALTWAVTDFMDSEDPLNVGPFGISATRRGNFAVQNADFLLSIGSRLDTHATGSPLTSFARGAWKAVVDVDASELGKFPNQGLSLDLAVQADVRHFLSAFERKLNNVRVGDIEPWHERIRQWRTKYPSVQAPWRDQKGAVNPYVFLEALSKELDRDAVVTVDCGGNTVQTFQTLGVRKGQKVLSSFNNAPMGYSLPGAIGACFANDRRPVVCITGDGGLQVNLQELGTVVRHNLPIRIFVFNNHGYGIIQQTQDDWLEGRYCASRAETGLTDPDYARIAEAFGMAAVTVREHRDLDHVIRRVLAHDGPILCNLEMRPDQRIVPMLKAGRPIEDATPLLDRAEFLENMIVPPHESSR